MAATAPSDDVVIHENTPAQSTEAAVETDMTAEPAAAAPIESMTAAEAPAPHVADFVATDETPASHPAAYTVSAVSRRPQGERIVRTYMGWASAAGLLPLPGLDVTGAIAVQVKMLHAMTKLYEVPFNKSLARQLLLVLIGGGGSMVVALPVAIAFKAVPVVGTAASMLLSPVVAATMCYANGNMFLRHFENGGTLETFEPSSAMAAAAA
jgi:uncharacterized protein (DUF697 family)